VPIHIFARKLNRSKIVAYGKRSGISLRNKAIIIKKKNGRKEIIRVPIIKRE